MKIDIHRHQKDEESSDQSFHCALIDKIHFDGIHPWLIDKTYPQKLLELKEKCIRHKLLLLGETGLDRLKSEVDFELQTKVFKAHLELAQHFKLPVVIHCLKAHSDFLKILKCYSGVRFLIHDYSAGEKELSIYLKYDVYFSFGRSLLRENSKAQIVFKKIPRERIFLETDDDSALSIEVIYHKAFVLRDDINEEVFENNFSHFFNNSNNISPADFIKDFTSRL